MFLSRRTLILIEHDTVVSDVNHPLVVDPQGKKNPEDLNSATASLEGGSYHHVSVCVPSVYMCTLFKTFAHYIYYNARSLLPKLDELCAVVPKSNNHHEPSNYRPISLFPILGKHHTKHHIHFLITEHLSSCHPIF